MINFRRILELHYEEISQRTISSSTGHSRNTVPMKFATRAYIK
ncbi:hypothetical protein [Oceanobacillus sp. CF4.6]